ncbi:MAG: exodeoxyribonuclease V subunit gamma [Rhabdochlamydiaceae bacterium]|nr:exodeoxyribonuclease V subunit gamma [Rhabdochlamydiaceae bacterium]
MKVFVSNKLSNLSKALQQELFSNIDNPLEKRWVIVPSEDVKLSLYLDWLQTSTVVTGIQTITYNELIRKIFPELPSKTELALRIETALDEMSELKTYLKDDSPIRTIELSMELSSLFLKYLERPSYELLEWIETEGWQQKLWKMLFGASLPTALVRPLRGRFFFYHTSSIAPYQWDVFSTMDISWFLFSPSEMYTGDLVSERQQAFLLQRAKTAAQDSLRDYFEENPSLLSNWIGHSLPLFDFLEDAERVELFKKPEELSTLQTLQREWFTFEKEESTPDTSLQLHSAPTLMREVEVVWEIIQRLPFKPREIVVLAPDIDSYAATIEWVFKQRGGPFDYSIKGIQARSHSPLLQGLELLLSLPSHRFSFEAFKKLLLCTPFLKRFQLSVEEAKELATWMTELHLRYDLSGPINSWNASLKRAVESLVLSGSIDFSDTPLMNRWIEMTLLFEKELEPLLDGKERSGEEWASLIEGWIKAFFSTDEEADILRSILATLRSERVQGLFSYETIEYHLKAAFKNPSGSMHASNPDTVRFTSLKEGAIIPAKAFICMGMQAGSFPRLEPPSSLPLLKSPHRSLEDRYLLLQALAHAEKHVIMTYVRCHPDDGKEVSPSPLIQELEKDRGGLMTIHHPPSALDPINYQASGYRSYSKLHYNLLFSNKKTDTLLPLTSNPKKNIDLRILKKLARHPVQFYLEEGLGIRFPWKEKDSEFLFSPLEMHRLRKASHKSSPDELIDNLSKEGKLPSGSFKSVALESIQKELQDYQSALMELNVDPKGIYSLELSPHAQKLTQLSEDYFVAPALKITLPSGEDIEILGVLEDLTPKGLLFHGDESLEDLLKIWPLYVAAQNILGNIPLLLTKKKTALTIPLDNPLETLKRYLAYFQKSLQSPSPLLPAWGRRIFKGDKIPASTDDTILLWAKQRNLLPRLDNLDNWDNWVDEWRSSLHEALHELI